MIKRLAPFAFLTALVLGATDARSAEPARLRAELIVPSVIHRDAATTPLVLRVHNEGKAPVDLRHGGDDESIEITAHGPGARRKVLSGDCPEIFILGEVETIPGAGYVDVPITRLISGQRCHQSEWELTKTGLHSIDVEVRGHVGATPATVRAPATTVTVI